MKFHEAHKLALQ